MIMIILLEMCAIRQFFVTDIEEALVLLFILQLPAMICLLFTTMIGDYIHREKFNIYYCKLENGIDIDYIKENYCIADINESCVLFVDKGNYHNFCVWTPVSSRSPVPLVISACSSQTMGISLFSRGRTTWQPWRWA